MVQKHYNYYSIFFFFYLGTLNDMTIKFYRIILAVNVLAVFLEWAGFDELWDGNRPPNLATLTVGSRLTGARTTQ